MNYPVYYVIADDTLPHLFGSYDGGTGASLTLTGLATSDIEIFKDGGTTARASDSGYAMLGTDGIDEYGVGIHGFSIDTSDNTDAGFYAVGPWYHVVINSVTIDAQTVRFVACAFRLLDATRGMAGTALPDAAAEAAGGLYTRGTGAGQINQDANGRVDVNIEAISADAPAATNAESFFDGTGYAGTGNTIPTVTTLTGHTPQTGDSYARLGAPIAASISADIQVIDTNVDSVLADTGTDGVVVAAASKTGYTLTATTGLGNQTANITGNLSGSVGSVTGNVDGNVTGSVGSLGATAKSDVNAEVVDVIDTDTSGEPGQGLPPATTDLRNKIDYLYKSWRNLKKQDATTWELYNDAGTTVDQKATLSDDGTDFTFGEKASGP